MIVLASLLAVVCLPLTSAFAKKPSSEPGQQVITARWTETPTVIDGAIGPGEYSAAIPVHVKFNKPATTPGIVPVVETNPFFPPPDNPDDLSYTISVMYDEDNLYMSESDQIIQSWDTASKVGEMNDWSVCTTWLFSDNRYYLLDLYRKRLEFPALTKAVKIKAQRWGANLILIEAMNRHTDLTLHRLENPQTIFQSRAHKARRRRSIGLVEG